MGCSPWEEDPGLVLWLSPGDPQGLQKKRPSDVQTAVLRRHLLELTQSFIIPLVRPARGRGPGTGGGGGVAGCGPDSLPSRPQEHYMASLMPLQKGIVPWKVWSRGGWGFSVRARGVPGKCPGESPKWPRRAPVRLVLQHQLARHSPRCHRLLPRSAPSARMTSCKAWSDLAPSSPVSSRATGWASTGGRPIGGVQGSRGQWAHATTVQPTGAHSHRPPAPTGGFSSPPILTGGTGSGTGR